MRSVPGSSEKKNKSGRIRKNWRILFQGPKISRFFSMLVAMDVSRGTSPYAQLLY